MTTLDFIHLFIWFVFLWFVSKDKQNPVKTWAIFCMFFFIGYAAGTLLIKHLMGQ